MIQSWKLLNKLRSKDQLHLDRLSIKTKNELRIWWECSGDKLWVMNLRRLNFVAQDDKYGRRSGNQALG